MFFKYPWAEIRCGWISNAFPDSDIVGTLSKFKHYDVSMYNHRMFLINLAKHTDTFLPLNEPDLPSKDPSTQEEDAKVIIAGSHQSFEKTKKQEIAHNLSQSFVFFCMFVYLFVFHQAAGQLPFFGFTPAISVHTTAANNLTLHNKLT